MEDDVNTTSVGDMVDAIKRGAGELQREAADAIERMRRRYVEERQKRAIRLGAVVVVAYLVLRRR